MKFESPLIVVSDMNKSLEFYKNVLGLEVETDFGANKTLSGGVVLQTLNTWKTFIDGKDVFFNGNDSELYFEEDNFDQFEERLKSLEIDYVHPVKEHSWGQRVVRFFDPDKHIIEVGENIHAVCQRFFNSGMTVEEVAKRMDVPVDFVKLSIK